MELRGIECSNCEIYFFVKNEAGKYNCPECNYENEILIIEDEIDEHDLELINKTYQDLKEVIDKWGIELSNQDILDFVVKVNKKIKENMK